MLENLASYRNTIQQINSNWPDFRRKRQERLAQQKYGTVEKVAENILEDLLTMVLDWPLQSVNNQVQYADILLSRPGMKYLIIEAKRPGALAWSRSAVEAALSQARRYADEQKVKSIAVSDGVMLYAADIEPGGLKDRVFVNLDSTEPPESLWWLSKDGIWRFRDEFEDASLRLLPEVASAEPAKNEELVSDDLLHPKYKIPARCFAYVGNAANPKTWKLPYRLADGTVDTKRLPKAAQSILMNYRGANVSGIGNDDMPGVLLTLARAAASLGKMPHQTGDTSPVYSQLASALEQLGRYEEIQS